MSDTWKDVPEPPAFHPTLADTVRIILRAVPLGFVVFTGLLFLLLLRLIERPLCGLKRPVTPYITQFVCRFAFVILGIKFTTSGEAMTHDGAVVANHSSWLDIFALNAKKRIFFVSKSEVASWPGIGWLARATGTVFIKRDRKEASKQIKTFQDRLKVGHKLLFFPEGTSSDSCQVLPFKSTLFAAFFAQELKDFMWVQPVTVRYSAPMDETASFYGWWGDMDFAPHLLKTLATRKPGRIEVVYHRAVKVSDFTDRKALSAHCEAAVRGGLVAVPHTDLVC